MSSWPSLRFGYSMHSCSLWLEHADIIKAQIYFALCALNKSTSLINSIVQAFIYCMLPKAYVAISGNTQFHLTTSLFLKISFNPRTRTVTKEGVKRIITGPNTSPHLHSHSESARSHPVVWALWSPSRCTSSQQLNSCIPNPGLLENT